MQWLFGLLMVVGICAEVYELPLGELGSICYTRDDKRLLQIERLGPSREVMYVHSYCYNEEGGLVSENLIGDLGEVVYENGTIKSPYGSELYEYDEKGNLIRQVRDGIQREYVYDTQDRLITDERMCDREFIFNDENQLVKVVSPDCTVEYGYKGTRRILKRVHGKTEFYGYLGINEVAILNESGDVKELRIPGLSWHKDIVRPIAIETPDAIYAPLHDVQGNIVKLVNMVTKEVISLDKEKPGNSGHKGKDHYHKYNPEATSDEDLYLDANGQPVPKNSPESHLYLK